MFNFQSDEFKFGTVIVLSMLCVFVLLAVFSFVEKLMGCAG